jgi:hypothetical protein
VLSGIAKFKEKVVINTEIDRMPSLKVIELMQETEAIAGKVKTLLKASRYNDTAPENIFELPIYEGGDHYLIEDTLKHLERLYYSIKELV